MASHSPRKNPKQAPDLTFWITKADNLGRASHELHCKLSAQMILVLPVCFSRYLCFMPTSVSQHLHEVSVEGMCVGYTNLREKLPELTLEY